MAYYRLSSFKEVKTDVNDAKIWYHSRQPGLEKRFSKAIKNALEKLKFNPYTHSIRHNNTRIAHPAVFPYSIHFYIDEKLKRVVIIGIVHNSRDSEFLLKRKY